MSDLNQFYIKAYRNLNFMVPSYTNLKGKNIMRYKRIGYNLNVMRQSKCLVINQIIVDGYAALFNCTPVDRASDSIMVPTKSYSFWLVGTGALVCCLVHRGSTDFLFLLQIFSGVV